MAEYINKYANDAAIQAAVDGGELIKPYVALDEAENRIDWNSKIIDYSKVPLTFEILTDGYINWKNNAGTNLKTIQYSKNNGEWTSITSTNIGVQIYVASGDTVQFKGDNTQYGLRLDSNAINTFSGSTAQFNIKGNIMSLINSTNFYGLDLPSGVPANFVNMFAYTPVISAENLVLPSRVINQISYLAMFRNCTSLTTPPKVIGDSMTRFAFNGSYNYALKDMFINCTSLTKAPELPNFLSPNNYCYEQMFKNCTSLNYIKCLSTTITPSSLYNGWVNGVASTGTFVKAAGVNWRTGGSGIPSGWTVIEE